MTLSDNVNAGNAAREVLDLAAGMSEGSEAHYWRTIAREAASKCGRVLVKHKSFEAMDYEEALKFEAVPVPFGKFAGYAVREVPVDYWTAITESPFQTDLVRYLRSQRYQEVQADD